MSSLGNEFKGNHYQTDPTFLQLLELLLHFKAFRIRKLMEAQDVVSRNPLVHFDRVGIAYVLQCKVLADGARAIAHKGMRVFERRRGVANDHVEEVIERALKKEKMKVSSIRWDGIF